MFKLDLENAEDLWIKLPTSVGTEIKQENSRKTSASSSFTTQKPLTVWITTNCRKFLEKGKQDYLLRREYFLTCLLRNLYAGQEATYMQVRIRHGTMNWFEIGKGVCQGCIVSACAFNFYTVYIIRNAGLDEAQAGI